VIHSATHSIQFCITQELIGGNNRLECVREREGWREWEKGVRDVSESMGVGSILKFIYKSVTDKLDVNFHKWKINITIFYLIFLLQKINPLHLKC